MLVFLPAIKESEAEKTVFFLLFNARNSPRYKSCVLSVTPRNTMAGSIVHVQCHHVGTVIATAL